MREMGERDVCIRFVCDICVREKSVCVRCERDMCVIRLCVRYV